MKLLHAADLHLIVSRHGDRLADFEAVLQRLADDAEELDAAAVLLAGDTFDSRRPGPDALRLFADFLRRLRRAIILPGNHDGMTTIGDPTSHALLWLQRLGLPHVTVLTDPGWSRQSVHGGVVDLFALPYPHKRAMDEALADVPVDQRAAIVGQRVEGIIETYTDTMAKADNPRLFLGHVSTVGAALGSEAMMKMGWDAAIRPEVLAPFDYAALGHIHRRQQVGPRAWYAGSPLYLDFGDLGTDKGWLAVDIPESGVATVTPRSSRTRPMQAIEATVKDRALALRPAPIEPGAIVRFRVTGTERPAPADLAAAVRWLRDMGASYVKTEVRLERPVGEARTLEVNPEANTLDALAAWLEANGHPAEPTMSVGRTLLAALEAA